MVVEHFIRSQKDKLWVKVCLIFPILITHQENIEDNNNNNDDDKMNLFLEIDQKQSKTSWQ